MDHTRECRCSWYGYHSLFCKSKGDIIPVLARPGLAGAVAGGGLHGGIVAEADGMLEIIEAVKSPWFGVNLDSGNFHTEWPYRDLARIAPYSINVQLKVEMRPKGRPHEPANLERLARILRYANYQGYVVLEYEAKPDPYKAVPEYIEKLKKVFA